MEVSNEQETRKYLEDMGIKPIITCRVEHVTEVE
jgi:hypothetical protein